MLQRLKIVKNALKSVTEKLYHYEAPNDITDDYIVYFENSEGSSVSGDNYKLEQSISGNIYLYSKNEHCPLFDEIQNSLCENRISFVFIDAEYDPETEIICWSWEFDV